MAVVFAYLYFGKGSLFGWSPFNHGSGSINYAPPTKEEKQAGEDAKKQTITNNPPNNSTTKPDTQQNTSNSGTTEPSKAPNITITAANQNGSTLQVRTLIEQVTNQGQCTLTLSQNGNTPITNTADVQPLANSSTCKGFNIDVSSLATGKWTLAVTYQINGQKSSASQDITLQ